MNVDDKSSWVVHGLAKLLEETTKVKEKLQGYPTELQTKPDISAELLVMLSMADDFVELVEPSFMPRESQIEMRITDNTGLDFTPWFLEKVSFLKSNVKDLIKALEPKAGDVVPPSSPKMTNLKWHQELIDAPLELVLQYARTVYDQVLTDKLEIREISST